MAITQQEQLFLEKLFQEEKMVQAVAVAVAL
jgi:hypothetical protein